MFVIRLTSPNVRFIDTQDPATLADRIVGPFPTLAACEMWWTVHVGARAAETVATVECIISPDAPVMLQVMA